MKKKSVAIPVTLATGVLAVGTVGFQANQVSADTIVPTVSEEQATPVKVVSEQELASTQAAVTEAEQVAQAASNTATAKEQVAANAVQGVVEATDNLAKAEELVAKATEAEIEKTQTTIEELKETAASQETAQTLAEKELAEAKKAEKVPAEKVAQTQTAYEKANSTLIAAQATATAATNQVAEAQAALATAEANVATTTNQVATAEQAVQAAQTALQTAEQADKETAQQLAVAKENLAQAKQAQTTAEADLATKVAAVTTAESSVKEAQAAVAAAEAYLASLVSDGTELTPLEFFGAEVEEPSEGNAMVGVSGTFYEPDQAAILARINEIRKEAFDEGLVDRYVPLKWSTILEYTTQIRAAEAEYTLGHIRWTDKSVFTVDTDNPEIVAVRSENLAWNFGRSGEAMLTAIEQFYAEKEDFVNQTPDAVVGHYVSLINPNYTHTALSAFLSAGNDGWTGVAQHFTVGDTSEEAVGLYGDAVQILEAKEDYLFDYELLTPEIVSDVNQNVVLNVSAVFAPYDDYARVVSVYSGLTWESADENIAVVSESGVLTGIAEGETSVYVTFPNGKKETVKVKIVDIQKARDAVEQAKANLAKQEAELAKAKTARQAAQTSVENAKATVANRQTTYNQLLSVESKVTKAQATLTDAKEKAAAAKQDLTTAEQTLADKEQVASVAKQDLSVAQAAQTTAKNALSEAQASLSALQEITATKEAALKLAEANLAKTVADLKAAEAYLASLLNAQENYRLAQQLLEEAKVAAAEALAQRDAALEAKQAAQTDFETALAKYKSMRLAYEAQLALQKAAETKELKQAPVATPKPLSKPEVSQTSSKVTATQTKTLPATGSVESMLGLTGLALLGTLALANQRRRRN
ncbi:LPXTG cell wall anchor domain-containing protein [Streptococcus suis]|nr:LPXTG cell wall anchor domain-containing protein [Streptococcus suis]